MVSGDFLLTATTIANDLICLSGLDFRLRYVVCVHCSWDGQAGELRSPNSGELSSQRQPETMTYACPECRQTIAFHKGLNAQEVLQEMQAIREVLAAELPTTPHGYEEGAQQQEDPQKYDFATDLEKIRVSLLPEQPVVAAKVTKPEPARARPISDSISMPKLMGGDLDFADVRARLAGIT
jgi:hypothetical protein